MPTVYACEFLVAFIWCLCKKYESYNIIEILCMVYVSILLDFNLILSRSEVLATVFHCSLSLQLYVCVSYAVQVSCGFEGGAGYIVLENGRLVEVCVSVPTSQLLQFNFTLNLTTVDGSASECVSLCTICMCTVEPLCIRMPLN